MQVDEAEERKAKAERRRQKILGSGSNRLAQITGESPQLQATEQSPEQSYYVADTYSQQAQVQYEQKFDGVHGLSKDLSVQSKQQIVQQSLQEDDSQKKEKIDLLRESQQLDNLQDEHQPVSTASLFSGYGQNIQPLRCALYSSQLIRLVVSTLYGVLLARRLELYHPIFSLIIIDVCVLFGSVQILLRNKQQLQKMWKKIAFSQSQDGQLISIVFGMLGLQNVWASFSLFWQIGQGIVEDICFAFVATTIGQQISYP
eukprot:TRINITY_DN769_c0_g2_i1.p1 TRINITY_DN769_c0_g2~~TRINITY_DN769_c0_g2_i1.p1  ORF type:complete len:258 (-),score=22.11 TRINITY_DN769_c0_g2_i1:222-995(-)